VEKCDTTILNPWLVMQVLHLDQLHPSKTEKIVGIGKWLTFKFNILNVYQLARWTILFNILIFKVILTQWQVYQENLMPFIWQLDVTKSSRFSNDSFWFHIYLLYACFIVLLCSTHMTQPFRNKAPSTCEWKTKWSNDLVTWIEGYINPFTK
jgi:hypothetical protein